MSDLEKFVQECQEFNEIIEFLLEGKSDRVSTAVFLRIIKKICGRQDYPLESLNQCIDFLEICKQEIKKD